MKSYNELFSELESIRLNYNLTGDSLIILNRLLARSMYENQIENVTELLESSFFRSQILNNKISHAFNSGYSINRGSNQRIKFVDMTALTSINVKKFDVIATIGDYNIVAAEDIYYDKDLSDDNILSFEGIICKAGSCKTYETLVKKDQLFFDVPDKDISEDYSVELIRDETSVELKTTNNYKDRFEPPQMWVQVMTHKDYSVRVINTHIEVESPDYLIGLNFRDGDKVVFKYVNYTSDEINVSKLKFITGFDRNAQSKFIPVTHIPKESDMMSIYLNALKCHHDSIYQPNVTELKDILMEQYQEFWENCIIVKDKYEKLGLTLKTPSYNCEFLVTGILYEVTDEGLKVYKDYTDLTLKDIWYCDYDGTYKPFTNQILMSSEERVYSCFIYNRDYGKITDTLGTKFIESGRYKLFITVQVLNLSDLFGDSQYGDNTRGPLNYSSVFRVSTRLANLPWKFRDYSVVYEDKYDVNTTIPTTTVAFNTTKNKTVTTWTYNMPEAYHNINTLTMIFDHVTHGGNDLKKNGKYVGNSSWSTSVKIYSSSGLYRDYGVIMESHHEEKKYEHAYHQSKTITIGPFDPSITITSIVITSNNGNNKPITETLTYYGLSRTTVRAVPVGSQFLSTIWPNGVSTGVFGESTLTTFNHSFILDNGNVRNLKSFEIYIKAQGKNDNKSNLIQVKVGTAQGSGNLYTSPNYSNTYAPNDRWQTLLNWTTVNTNVNVDKIYVTTLRKKGGDSCEILLRNCKFITTVASNDCYVNFNNASEIDKTTVRYINKIEGLGNTHKDDFYYGAENNIDPMCINQLAIIPSDQYENKSLSQFGLTWDIVSDYNVYTAELTPVKIKSSFSEYGYNTVGKINERQYQVIAYKIPDDIKSYVIGNETGYTLTISNGSDVRYSISNKMCRIKTIDNKISSIPGYYYYTSDLNKIFPTSRYKPTTDSEVDVNKQYYLLSESTYTPCTDSDFDYEDNVKVFKSDIDYYEISSYVGVNNLYIGLDGYQESDATQIVLNKNLMIYSDYLVFIIPRYDLTVDTLYESKLVITYKIPVESTPLLRYETGSTRRTGAIYFEKIITTATFDSNKSYTWNDGDCQKDLYKTIDLGSIWNITSLKLNIKAQGRNDNKSVLSTFRIGTSNGAGDILNANYGEQYATNDRYTAIVTNQTLTVNKDLRYLYLMAHNKGGDRFEVTISGLTGTKHTDSGTFRLYDGSDVKGKYYFYLDTSILPVQYENNPLGTISLHHLKINSKNKYLVYKFTKSNQDDIDQDDISSLRNGSEVVTTNNCNSGLLYDLRYSSKSLLVMDYNTKLFNNINLTSLDIDSYLDLALEYATIYLRWWNYAEDELPWEVLFNGFRDYPNSQESEIDVYYLPKKGKKLPYKGTYSEPWFNYYMRWRYDRETKINLWEKATPIDLHLYLEITYNSDINTAMNEADECVRNYITSLPRIFSIYELNNQILKLNSVSYSRIRNYENDLVVVNDLEYLNLDTSTIEYKLVE